MQMPHRFLAEECDELGHHACPRPDDYGVGMVFLPQRRRRTAQHCEELFEQIVREEGQPVLGWRDVPTDNSTIGPDRAAPASRSCARSSSAAAASRRRRRWPSSASSTSSAAASRTRSAPRTSRRRGMFYVPSLSCKTLVYKGMLNAAAARRLLPRPRATRRRVAPWPWSTRASAPTRSRAGPAPTRTATSAHNGEINTLRGNVNWMHARESLFASDAVRRRHQEDPADHRRRAAATRPCSTTPWSCSS